MLSVALISLCCRLDFTASTLFTLNCLFGALLGSGQKSFEALISWSFSDVEHFLLSFFGLFFLSGHTIDFGFVVSSLLSFLFGCFSPPGLFCDFVVIGALLLALPLIVEFSSICFSHLMFSNSEGRKLYFHM